MTITNKERQSHLRQGFTLIELVVVILILGILAATVGPAAFRYVSQGQANSAKTSINALAQAIDSYHAEIGSYPKQLQDLVERPSGPHGKKWAGSFLKKPIIPADPWSNEFVYKVTPNAEHPYELYSYGKNGPDAPEEEHIDVWKI